MQKVKYEEMLPHEFLEALQRFPVAYVPVGSLEWHGRHMALGNDSLKAYGILLKTAEKYGGIVVPPTYWGHMKMYDKPCSTREFHLKAWIHCSQPYFKDWW